MTDSDVTTPNADTSISVIIVTWRRPEYLRATLEHLGRMQVAVEQVLVVVAPNDPGVAVLDSFGWATKVVFPPVAGHRTRARNEGLMMASGSVIAFLDDDAYPREDWSRELAGVFGDPGVAAVAGRTCNGEPGEDLRGVTEVGRLLPNGQLTANFAANTGANVDVDHGIGANMAFRRGVLAELGGFRDDFQGTALLEETDLFLRIGVLGRRVVFAPRVVVDHVAAPHVSGRRFDWRYMFWARHNHLLFLARNYGLASPVVRSWMMNSIVEAVRPWGPGGRGRRLVRSALAFLGLAAGLGTSIARAGLRPRDPRRVDQLGLRVTAALSRTP